MDYLRLGSSGLKVSQIGLGMMTYGDAAARAWHPVPDPPLGRLGAGRGDNGCAASGGAGRQGTLHRGVQHVCLRNRNRNRMEGGAAGPGGHRGPDRR